MVSVRAICERCGEVTLLSSEVLVRQRRGEVGATVCFACPGCGQQNAVEVEPEHVAMLRQAGVRCVVWSHPTELDEVHPPGPPFTVHDVVRLHALLTRDDWFDELLRAAR